MRSIRPYRLFPLFDRETFLVSSALMTEGCSPQHPAGTGPWGDRTRDWRQVDPGQQTDIRVTHWFREFIESLTRRKCKIQLIVLITFQKIAINIMGAFGKFHEKTFIFSKVESDPRIQLSKSGTFREISLGFDLPNGFEVFGTTDNFKN